MIDGDDSDDERSNFFSGISTNQSSFLSQSDSLRDGARNNGGDAPQSKPAGKPLFRAPKRFYQNKNLAKFLDRLPCVKQQKRPAAAQ
jgi:hypothetical protein